MAQKIELKGKSFLTLKDFTKEEIKYFLSLASYLKTKKKIYTFSLTYLCNFGNSI